MRLWRSGRVIIIAAAAGFVASGHADAQTVTGRYPAANAVGVNPDAHLVLTLSAAPTVGRCGKIRIDDAADHATTAIPP